MWGLKSNQLAERFWKHPITLAITVMVLITTTTSVSAALPIIVCCAFLGWCTVDRNRSVLMQHVSWYCAVVAGGLGAVGVAAIAAFPLRRLTVLG